VSTITRRLAAIGEGHKVSGHPNPHRWWAGGLVGAGYDVVVDAELVAGDGSAPSFYGVAPALVLLGVFCDEADGRAPRWVASWTDATGQAQKKVLHGTDEATAADEAESLIFRMAYL